VKPLAPKFLPRKKAMKRASGIACVLCPSKDAEARALYQNAPMCDRCARNQTVGAVGRLMLNAAGRYLFGIGGK
jgi:hypothetical protein